MYLKMKELSVIFIFVFGCGFIHAQSISQNKSYEINYSLGVSRYLWYNGNISNELNKEEQFGLSHNLSFVINSGNQNKPSFMLNVKSVSSRFNILGDNTQTRTLKKRIYNEYFVGGYVGMRRTFNVNKKWMLNPSVFYWDRLLLV